MAQSWLLTWNPKKTASHVLRNMRIECLNTGDCKTNWNTCSRNLHKGDTFYLMKIGSKQKNGIIGYGIIDSDTYFENYINENGEIKKCKSVDVIFKHIFEDTDEGYILLEKLVELFPKQCWLPKFSGLLISQDISKELANLIQQRINV